MVSRFSTVKIHLQLNTHAQKRLNLLKEEKLCFVSVDLWVSFSVLNNMLSFLLLGFP